MTEHQHRYLSPSPAGHDSGGREAGDPDRCACGEERPESAVEFTVRGLPVPQGSARAFMAGGRPIIVTKQRGGALGAWRSAITTAASAATGAVMEGPLAVWVVFMLPRPKSAPRRVEHPATRPDIDKLLRAVLDGCTAVVWRDDAQVVEVCARKEYARDGVLGAYVRVELAGPALLKMSGGTR